MKNFKSAIAVLLILMIVCMASACRPRQEKDDAPATLQLRATPTTLPVQSPPSVSSSSDSTSRFGVDYVFPFMALYQDEVWPKMYQQAGAGWVNFAEVSWATTEPNEPRGGKHTYNWKDLDRSVALWQKYDFEIVFSLRLEKGWFAGPVKYRPDVKILGMELWFERSDRLPATEHLDSYRAWMRAMVERYDGDGKDDMPGLKKPILHYQVGNEYSNPAFWSGTLEDYAVLLREARTGAQEASPNVKIISNGIRWNDLFHNDPQALKFEETFTAFLKRLPSDGWREGWKRHRELTEGTIALAGVYDILDAGGNGPYPTMSQGYMTWVRQQLAKKNLRTRIWDMESRSEPALVLNDVAAFHPELEIPGGNKILQALKTKGSAQHDQAVAWYRAEQARILTQVFVTRFAAGFEKVFMGMASDWEGTLGELATPNPYIGLLDSKGNPLPAFYAMKLLTQKIDRFDRAEKAKSSDGVELYRFIFRDGRAPVWVAWIVEEKVRGMNDPLPIRKISLKEVLRPAMVWETPTSTGESAPSRLEATVNLSPTPLLIVEDGR